MPVAQFTSAEWLALLQHELLLLAAVFFAIGLIDELAIDITYAWLRLTGRAKPAEVGSRGYALQDLSGMAAVFIPAWEEDTVIGPTLAHALASWPQDDVRIYVGCYRNDPATIASVSVAARGDDRIRVVIVGADGPTSKAHCLNRLYQALCDDETRLRAKAHMVVLHDAEDMVDEAALVTLDRAIWHDDFVQLPVMALPQSDSPWIAGHYSDEFAESHAKAMVVRDALGVSVPGAGVGSAIRRPMLDRLARLHAGEPFASASLTEDYELGQRICALGGTGRFLRARTHDGRLVATRAFFPSDLSAAVRQKTRWTHGIALQGWDRLGWRGTLAERWMTLRDRRGPLAALVLAIAYILVLSAILSQVSATAGFVAPLEPSPMLRGLLVFTMFGLVWRLLARGLFTGREYGVKQGLMAVPRVLVSNVIAIMSGRRALAAYWRSLRGAPVVWDKTAHHDHPSLALPKAAYA
ncbi:glycosyl transferase family protein [Erythrobacter aquimaris]|uniref:Glycosyl transferase family protein n=1 Tax=Qipengyuania aquimaris TaxID=255984 RepID=A0A6I4TP72_9SPHN|nr:glycosyl transferase family protein [Qipengyuania aquimaris]MXO96348.1 glycosyl transferase family protein [Qipengyuania aquimaris]